MRPWCSEAHKNTVVFGEQPDSLSRILSRRAWDRTCDSVVIGHRLTDAWHTPCSMEFGRQLFCDSFSIVKAEKVSIWSNERRLWKFKCDGHKMKVIYHVLFVPVFWTWHCSPEIQMSYGTRTFIAELATSSHLLLSCIYYSLPKATGDRTSLNSENTVFHTRSRRKDVTIHTQRTVQRTSSVVRGKILDVKLRDFQ
jgi:hypothetical protein